MRAGVKIGIKGVVSVGLSIGRGSGDWSRGKCSGGS